MKRIKFTPLIVTETTPWMLEMWEVEAKHSPFVNSRLKMFIPHSSAAAPTKPSRRTAKTGTRAAAKV